MCYEIITLKNKRIGPLIHLLFGIGYKVLIDRCLNTCLKRIHVLVFVVRDKGMFAFRHALLSIIAQYV